MKLMSSFVLALLVLTCVHSTASASSKVPHDAQQELAAQTQMQRALRDAFSSPAARKLPIEARGRVLLISRIDASGIALDDERRGTRLDVAWAEVSVEIYEGLMNKARSRSASSLIALATLALDRGQPYIAGKLLGEAARLDKALEAEIHDLLKRKRQIESVGAFEGALVDAGELGDLAKSSAFIEKFRGKLNGKEAATLDLAGELSELSELKEIAREHVASKLADWRDKEIGALEESTGIKGDLTALRALKAKLDARRIAALDLIYDESLWPYPYASNDKQVTAEVLKRLAAVREIWNSKEVRKGKHLKDADKAALRASKLNAAIALLNGEAGKVEVTEAGYLAMLASNANKPLTVQALASSHEELALMAENFAISLANAKARADFKGKAGAPDDASWAQLEATNAYRVMMGRRALLMNFKLYWAAQHHSNYCVNTLKGKIAHVVEGEPRGANPTDRANTEGYNDGVSENIQSGATDAQDAHDGWLTSSGHHRNLLDAQWRVMGNGKSGSVWTQLFGTLDEGADNMQSKAGK